MVKINESYILYTVCLIVFSGTLSQLLNIPILRELVPIAFIPLLGILYLNYLEEFEISKFKYSVLSVGISIFLLMFIGLGLNSLRYFTGYDSPLKKNTVVITFALVIFITIIHQYEANRIGTIFINIPSLSVIDKTHLGFGTSALSFSIFGTIVMNRFGMNKFMIVALSLVISYILILIYMDDRFLPQQSTLVFTLFLMSLGIQLQYGLRSSDLLGHDIHTEFRIFSLVVENGYWKMYPSAKANYNAMLSVTILPTMIKYLSHINDKLIFRLLVSISASVIPVIIYYIFEGYLLERYAALASLFYMSQKLFFFHSSVRTAISVMFFALIVLVLVDTEISHPNHLFILFAIGLILSHYATAYLAIGMLAITWMSTRLYSTILPHGGKSPMHLSINRLTIFKVIFLGIFAFLWYSIVTYRPFHDLIRLLLSAVVLDQPVAATQAYESIRYISEEEWIGYQIQLISSWIVIVVLQIGGAIALWDLWSDKEIKQAQTNHPLLIFLGLSGSVVMAGSLVGIGYNPQRIFYLVTVAMAPFFVIAFSYDTNMLERVNLDHVFTIILILFILSNSGLSYQATGYSKSVLLNDDGFQYQRLYVHEQTKVADKWLASFGGFTRASQTVYGDAGLLSLRQETTRGVNINTTAILRNKSKLSDNSYIYLRKWNTETDKLLSHDHKTYKLENYNSLFRNKNKIYDNSGGKIYHG